MNPALPRSVAIDSPADVAQALRWTVAQASARRARRLRFVDPDFTGWPLDDEPLLDALGAWLRLPQRELVLLAARFEAPVRAQARFAAWRRERSHAVLTRVCEEADRPGLPSGAVDDGPVLLQLTDRARWRGLARVDAREAQRWREATDAVLQRSSPDWPVTTVGL